MVFLTTAHPCLASIAITLALRHMISQYTLVHFIAAHITSWKMYQHHGRCFLRPQPRMGSTIDIICGAYGGFLMSVGPIDIHEIRLYSRFRHFPNRGSIDSQPYRKVRHVTCAGIFNAADTTWLVSTVHNVLTVGNRTPRVIYCEGKLRSSAMYYIITSPRICSQVIFYVITFQTIQRPHFSHIPWTWLMPTRVGIVQSITIAHPAPRITSNSSPWS